MINSRNVLGISFLQAENDSYVNQTTYSKQARGQFLNFLIKNRITDINKMKNFSESNYAFNTALSHDSNYIFTRTN